MQFFFENDGVSIKVGMSATSLLLKKRKTQCNHHAHFIDLGIYRAESSSEIHEVEQMTHSTISTTSNPIPETK